jgi:MOSC domain-containing protein YiiM
VTVVAGSGVEGDRYFGRHDEPGQNITLIEAEVVEAFLQEQGLPHDLSITHRNVITRGVRLNPLVGREFMVGQVRLRGVELCQPCLGLGSALASANISAKEVVKRFLHHGGIRADICTSGSIGRGDAIGLGVDSSVVE